MKALARRALLFAALGLALYATLFAAADRLVLRTGHAHPLFKIATAGERDFDWVILGASHAMPLDFDGVNADLERATGLRIVNLAAQGTGPLYQRFVLEEFLRSHRARHLLYAVDSFAFYSKTWNEERFADAKLLRRTPFSAATAGHLWRYVVEENVDPRAWLDYATGFSKVNDRERFQRDAWEGEAQFDRVFRPSSSALAKRIEYLYPGAPDPARLARYLGDLTALVEAARQSGMTVTVIRMPVPAEYLRRLPGEAVFASALAEALRARDVPIHDFSASLPDAKLYFDTDHLNRAGVARFVEERLRPILTGGTGATIDQGSRHERG
ncbi:MAG TPA: hypothetical protein VII36_00705 [Usitatibacter sp.]